MIAPKGKAIEINHGPKGGANEPLPKRRTYNGETPQRFVVQFTVNLPIPNKMKIIQSHFFFSIFVRIQSTRTQKMKIGIRIPSASVTYCRKDFPDKVNLLRFSKESPKSYT